jgi:isocitrate dehydrogenase (NAD+)
MSHSVTLIAGDGIGEEVAKATMRALAATSVKIKWDIQQAGLGAVHEKGTPLPEATLESIRKNGIALKGPTTTPVGTGHRSANVLLRQALDLYSCVRPVKSVPGIKTRYEDVDLIIVRENTEGLYLGQEMEVTKGTVISLKVVTQKASERIARSAFELARKLGRKRVTVVHKANILKMGDGLFLFSAEQVARDYPEIIMDDVIVDALCMKMVTDPSRFDVLLLENLYGDILSDLCAGLVGGLGVVPGANLGEKAAIFEAVHGSAPDIAGQNKANPTALMKSAAMMLEYMGEKSAADSLSGALDTVLQKGKVRTFDLGGQASTEEFTNAVIAAI